ncbi:unnamed protein product [Somion occarium]|uniref:Uncharacterized protein n=1 Tax=Somion occarium TaxID=3059160 RepID=A0ABP1D2Z8_9APHY
MFLVSKQCLKQIQQSKCRRHLPRVAVVRNIHASPISSFTLALPTVEFPSLPTRARDTRESIQVLKLQELAHSMNAVSPDPAVVWRNYRGLLRIELPRNVPLAVHQRVLRLCTPSPREMRLHLAERMKMNARPGVPHLYEKRFQQVIHNIREAGYTPTLEDYHYVLEHFAAVGHHAGSLQVLREIDELKFPKTSTTYALCLQALCHSLTLPCWHEDRPQLVKEISQTAQKLIDEMWVAGIPVSSVNVDLAVRVLKETLDMETLEKLLKVVYGIDLSFPDRPPVEYWDQAKSKPETGDLVSPLPGPQPFTTPALNTTLDILGRLGNVSKMVQLFEVITVPLPKGVSEVPSSSFDEDDDDFGCSSPAVSSFPLPHAQPNTTTFYTLIRWICEMDHTILARHYLLYAFRYDRDIDFAIRRARVANVKNGVDTPIFAPRVSITRGILQTVMGAANRNKNRNIEILKWVSMMIVKVLRCKRHDLKFYSLWRDQEASKLESAEDLSESEAPVANLADASSTRPTPLFELDINDTSLPPSSKQRLFNLDLHINLLERDIEEISELEKRCSEILARDTQRLKERLGRRVWKSKDVYFRVPEGRRVVSREHWQEIVNFREPPDVQGEDDLADLDGPPRRSRRRDRRS